MMDTMSTDPSADGVSDWERLFADQPAPIEQSSPPAEERSEAGLVTPAETASTETAPTGTAPTETAPTEAPTTGGSPADAGAVEGELAPGPVAVASRRRSLVRSIAAAVLVVLLVVASTIAFLERRRADGLAHTEAVRRDVALTSGAFSQALLSYDYTNLNKARSTVLGMATDTFAQNYTTAFTNGLSAAITQLKATSTATVRKVFVSDVNGNNAEAVVTIDSEVHSTAGTRQVVGSYLDLTLLRQGGRWKVNQVTSIAATSNNLTPNAAPPAGSTTPSAPTTTVAPSPAG